MFNFAQYNIMSCGTKNFPRHQVKDASLHFISFSMTYRLKCHSEWSVTERRISHVILLDYEERWSELEASTNPFAIIVMAHLKTKATTRKLQQREQWKWKLIRGLYQRGFEREQIIKLFEIIDNMMTLSTKLQESLESKIKQFEEERTVPLISNMELRGRKIGALEKSRDAIKTVLSVLFGKISSEIQQMLDKITNLALLEEILKLSVTANSLEEFKQSLPRIQ